MRELGQKAYRARQVLNWLYKNRATGFDSMTNLPARFRKRLQTEFKDDLPRSIEEEVSEDTSRKFRLQLQDGAAIETVLIPADERLTLCLSTQVGCKFGCTFCATGKMGFIRNLSPGEIVGHLLTIENLTGERIDNIVMMGMGEPLDNLENLLKALDIFTHHETLALSPRRITVSTIGIPEAMLALKGQFPHIGLSLSLNAPTPEVRRELMPIEETCPTTDLIETIKAINPGPQDPVTIEYVLLKGVNDSIDDAAKLCNLLEGIENVKINLIPFNPSKGIQYSRPEREAVELFQSTVKRRGYECFIRKSAGRDISAACGQLAIHKGK
jgi:23S rRNA (adenine2503-C2)-methyltransferase